MAKQPRDEQNKRFAAKSDEPRRVRSIRATDSTWEAFVAVAAMKGITPADLLESINWDDISCNTRYNGNQDGVIHSQSTPDYEAIAKEVLEDPVVTRGGKDRGSVRRAIQAMIQRLT